MNSSSDAPELSTLPESLRLLSLIWGFQAGLERTSRAMASTRGVSGLQRFLLRFVGLVPGITRDALANVMSCGPSDLQSDLQSLVTQNLLAERGEPAGYYLTVQGVSVNAVIEGTIEQAVSKALDEASPYERTSFQRMLTRILGHLDPPIP